MLGYWLVAAVVKLTNQNNHHSTEWINVLLKNKRQVGWKERPLAKSTGGSFRGLSFGPQNPCESPGTPAPGAPVPLLASMWPTFMYPYSHRDTHIYT